jgi:mRNA-degrading endonuclease RelE of RelBE toxin-antitoxin system
MRARILRMIIALAGDPRPSGVKALTGEAGLWRVRIGDDRVVYEIDDIRLRVQVVRIAHRSTSTDGAEPIQGHLNSHTRERQTPRSKTWARASGGACVLLAHPDTSLSRANSVISGATINGRRPADG